MAQATYTMRGVVLRKTKLGESDLILTLLAEDGSQVRAVAKGARKPTSSFAARLELYSVAEVLCAKGRSLDIVKEVRLAASNERVRCDMEHAACAAPIAELLQRVTDMGLENPRLFDLTCAAFAALGAAEPAEAPAFAAACLLKVYAFCGLRPSFTTCAVCGTDLSDRVRGEGDVSFSYSEGGVVCDMCRSRASAVYMPASVPAWSHSLLHATFSQVGELALDASTAFAILHLCQQWSREHVGSNLKSLNFLFTCGLF